MQLVVGALLHDIGKVVYRAGADSRKHALSGEAFLSAEEHVRLHDEEILHCVRYHHAADLRDAGIPQDAMAYIVYMADNIASAADRREKDVLEDGEGGFDKNAPLDSIFNLLNGNRGEMHYSPVHINMERAINFPIHEKAAFEARHYRDILRNLEDNLRGLEWTKSYVNSLLDVLEANLSFVPSSTNRKEVADISLYDHVRLTAAFAACIERYLAAEGEQDYRRRLFVQGKDFYSEKAFLLSVLDVSGIQKFIYTISSEKALKTLRARSFYLDFLMEHMADELLDSLGLTRANLIYSGGGRCYVLLANTEQMKKEFDAFLHRMNMWCMEQFDIALYLSGSCVECSSEMLRDEPRGSYAALHRMLSQGLSDRKAHRYTSEEIVRLNERKVKDDTRECKVCRHVGHVNDEGICPFCRGMQELSSRIMDQEYEFFAAVPADARKGLPIPGGYALTVGNGASAKAWQQECDALRIYGKNRFYTGKAVATRLWIGDYHTGETFEELANCARENGIKRLGVLRADVDDLGHAFAMGFSRQEDQRYVTISRTAGLSRQLSLFFKLHIRKILAHPEFTLDGKKKDFRHAAIVYSGGDDLFIVGAWDDVLELSVDIHRNFARYTEHTLTLSAGIGVYPHNYPISVMANEVAALEEKSKNLPGKNAVTLLEDGEEHTLPDAGNRKISDGTYHWDELESAVLGEKYQHISRFFDASKEHGKNFLYNLLGLLRNRGEKINFARYVYLLSRMEPEKGAGEEAVARYRDFFSRMVQWIQKDEDVRQLKTAIQIYAYATRETRDEHESH